MIMSVLLHEVGHSVTSSASYLIFGSWKAARGKYRSTEVWKVPGIGFSSCTAPTFNHVQGISNGGYKLSFRRVPEWKKHTGMILSMSARVREMEVQSRRVWRYVEAQNVPE